MNIEINPTIGTSHSTIEEIDNRTSSPLVSQQVSMQLRILGQDPILAETMQPSFTEA
jgi:hypothetical protein